MTVEVENKTADQRSRDIQVKATDDSTGTFTAVVSVFGNVDSYGDVMLKGSFAKSLTEWQERGANIPFLWSHDIQNPFAYVGEIKSARETDEGLEVEGKFDLDDELSKKAYKLMKSRRVREFSFGFFVREAGYAEKDGETVREVKDVDLIEVSMTQIGANRATRVIEVRSAEDDKPVVTPVPDEPAVPAVKTHEVKADELDSMIASLEKAGATLETTLVELKAAREVLAPSGEDTEDEPDAETGTADEKHAAASATETPDEEPSEAKSDDREAAVATADRLSILLKTYDIERLVQS